MEPPHYSILRASDVSRDIKQKRPFLWANGYHIVGIAAVGGSVAYLVATNAMYAMQPLCLYNYTGYFFEKSVEVLCRNDLTSSIISKAVTFGITFTGTIGTFMYSILRDGDIHEKERQAAKVMGQDDKVISKSEYAKLQKIMHPHISSNLDKLYFVPDEKLLQNVADRKAKALDILLDQILNSELSSREIYNSAMGELYTATAITPFLIAKMTSENVRRISQFAAENNLRYLTSQCAKY